ncbi:MAG: hypothetical protein QM760_03725 [Nibricoccus sp.]
MNWLLSIVISLLTGAAGLFGTAFLSTFLIRWFRISSFEGGSGYYAAALSILGGIVGLFVGLVCARVVAALPNPGFLKALGASLGTSLAILLTIALICRLCADIAPRMNGKALKLAIEIKSPAGLSGPLRGSDRYDAFASIELPDGGKSRSSGSIKLQSARQVEGRWFFKTTMELQTSARTKRLRVFLNDEHDLLFNLPLPSQPRKEHTDWSDWLPEFSSGTGFLMRYRVLVVEPPPPPPSPDEIAAKRETKAQAEFDAIPADAPIECWLPYTEYGARNDFLRQAVKNIESRPNLASELGALMNSEDHEQAARALWVVRNFDSFPPDLNAQVSAAGRKIAEVIRTFNATPPAEDPSMELAAQASIRFHSWMEAVRALRERGGGDFTAELQEILTLSRVRTDSHVMQADIRRVASYYLNLWANIAPLPGDPPPR